MILCFMPKTLFPTVRLRLRLQYQNDWLAFCYDSPERRKCRSREDAYSNKAINKGETTFSSGRARRRGFRTSLLPHSSGRTKVRLNHSL